MIMAERTVTEQEVIAALNKHAAAWTIPDYALVFNELFPELPKANELILVWDNPCQESEGTWLPFHSLTDEDRVYVLYNDGRVVGFDNYRRQTPAERGEG
ncbi:MAG: hypothetical protein ACI9N9_002364 [Enterobacterales bacterium]